MLDLDAVRARFPALSRVGDDGRPVVLVDAPGGSQVPDDVIEAVARHYRRGMSNTHGAFATSQETDGVIADARRAAADFTGADPDEIVFGPNATTLLLHVSRSFAKTLAPGDEVVVTRLDHDANVRPWVLAAADAGATVRWVDVREDDVTIDVESFEAALSPRTKLVAFTLASNAVGTIPPAADLVARAKGVGALVAVDGVHLAQHRLPDLHGIGADLLVCSPYKFFGPHLGILAARRSLLATWSPYKLVPSSDDVPERWETGTQNHEGLAGLARGGGLPRAARGRDGRVASRSAHRLLCRDHRARADAGRPVPRGRGDAPLGPSAGASPIAIAPPSARPRSRSGSATSIRPRRRRPWRRAASSSGTATTTLARSWSGSVSSRPAARCASGSVTTTRRTRWIGCWTPSASSASDNGVRSRGPSGR